MCVCVWLCVGRVCVYQLGGGGHLLWTSKPSHFWGKWCIIVGLLLLNVYIVSPIQFCVTECHSFKHVIISINFDRLCLCTWTTFFFLKVRGQRTSTYDFFVRAYHHRNGSLCVIIVVVYLSSRKYHQWAQKHTHTQMKTSERGSSILTDRLHHISLSDLRQCVSAAPFWSVKVWLARKIWVWNLVGNTQKQVDLTKNNKGE